jgi:hypothetical protein
MLDVPFLKVLLLERKRPLGRHEHGWVIEIRMNFTLGLFGACCVLPVVLADKGIEPDSLLESGAGNTPEVHNGEFYKKALQRMLPEFDDKGAFRC